MAPGSSLSRRRWRPQAKLVGLRKSRPETVPVRRPVPPGMRFLRVRAWAALAAGPLALAVAIAAPRTTVVQAAPSARAETVARPAADPAGVAEVFVDLWLRADARTPDNPASTAVRALAADAELPERPRTQKTSSAAPGEARVMAPGRRSPRAGGPWSLPQSPNSPVLRASPAGWWCGTSRLPAAAPTATRYGLAERPVRSPPRDCPEPEEAFRHSAPSDGVLAQSLGEFLFAYLAGSQSTGVERYLSPGVHIRVCRTKRRPLHG
ncbi:hypothetical protein LG634_34645 [Streptomyces bambusae]|uniref:hypothetical protein n=1 Tax=Streptomyces bambusae TaxID=1550616 RepID=UPI001CFFF425|nr:hypothetical protein [Streptomyces bambusae]MCB5169929.1 hypothetical protein [Streptomyces bambusae]